MKTSVYNQKGQKVAVYVPSKEQDAYQPKFMFQGTVTELLCAIVNSKIDARELAMKELSNRGLNSGGKWIGFNK